MAALTGKRWPLVGKKLVEEFPYIEAEVKYAVKEYARTATDVVARRTRLAFLNVQAADEALPRIVEIMAKELGWKKEYQKVRWQLAPFGSHDQSLVVLCPDLTHHCFDHMTTN